jgi:serine/threonine protein kinase
MPDQIGEHKLVRLLGQGGYGSVYLARDRNTNEPIAIKTLLPEHSSSPQAIGLFEREYSILEKMRNPGIVSVHMMGLDPSHGLYFTMPYLESGTLEDARQTGSASQAQLLNWWIDLVHIMAYAHSQGLVHRDLNPQNVVTNRGNVVVVDWGLGRVGGTRPHFTGPGGTPNWSPPELSAEGEAGANTDTYGLIGILAWILTGHTPWDVMGSEATLLIDSGFDSPALAALLQRGLSQQIDRFQNIQELAQRASEPLVWVKRRLLERAFKAEDFTDIFWPTLMQTNTNSLQPKFINIEFYRHHPHGFRQLSYLGLSREKQTIIDSYLQLGVRFAEDQGIPYSDRHLWRIQTPNGSMRELQWIFGKNNADSYRVIRQMDSMTPRDLQVVIEFLLLAEPMALDIP